MRYAPYKTITGWKTGTETEKENGRTILKLVMGEIYEDKSKNISSYIIEDIYKDILEEILDDPQKFSISVKPGRIPQLIIVEDGRLIIHNKKILEFQKYVMEKLTALPKDLVISAYLDMRVNSERPKKISSSTTALVALVNNKDETSFTIPFIRSVLCDLMENDYFNTSESEVKEYVRSLEYEELLSLLNDVIKVKNSMLPDDEFVKQLLNSGSLTNTDFETIVNKEIAFRLYKGTICKK